MTSPARRPWSLQTRLMVTIITAVAAILIAAALATSTILGSILQQNLRTRIADYTTQVARVLVAPFPGQGTLTAYEALDASRGLPHGFVLVVQSRSGDADGAYLADDDRIVALSADQLDSIARSLAENFDGTVTIDALGSYHVTSGVVGPSSTWVLGGLPTSEVNTTIGQLVTATALVTTGGLLILGAAIAYILRRSLRPLRAVADVATQVAAQPLAQGAVSITERVAPAQADERTEIGRVGHALNTLLDHVDASLEERQRNEERMRRFVADASHELRTPLASIRGYSELSLRSTTLDETAHASLERIQSQSLRMSALVEDLLLLARLDEGQELVYSAVDLTRLVVEAVADATVTGTDHRWVIDVEPEPVIVAGDTGRLQQVAVNLLANARTHTPAGTTVTVTVGREDSPSGSEAVLRVHDDGPGIDPALRAELFERFARGDRSRARKTGGTGLGLSIARAIVHAHGGTITVASAPADTTFTVRLPARPDDALSTR